MIPGRMPRSSEDWDTTNGIRQRLQTPRRLNRCAATATACDSIVGRRKEFLRFHQLFGSHRVCLTQVLKSVKLVSSRLYFRFHFCQQMR